MSEPKTRATQVRKLVPGLCHWTIHDERIDFRSDAYAIDTGTGALLIDPLPLTERALARLGDVTRIVLTGGFHQRAAWSLRRRFGVEVFAPRGACGLEEQPDRWFTDGERIASHLQALHRPGPTQPHFVLHWNPPGGPAVLFCADLLMRGGSGAFRFVPDEHQDDPARTRESVRRCIDLSLEVLCPAHGEPAVTDGEGEMRRALGSD